MRRLEETEGKHGRESELEQHLSSIKEKNLKEEIQQMKRQHEEEVNDLKKKYKDKCIIL